MNNPKIHTLLQDALEDEIPSANIHLWPDVQALVAGKHPQGVIPMNSPLMRRITRFAFAVVAVLALFALALATPQGRTFAQSILQLFNRTEKTSFLLSESQIAPEPDRNSPTAEPPAPLITVTEAETQAGFDIVELSFVPDGFTYLGVRMYGNAVNVEDQTPDLGGHLNITQSQEGYLQSVWDTVPAEFITPVKLGELNGEFVQGAFVVFPNATSATWHPDAAILRLRWQKDGIYYEIAKFGDVQAIEYLDQAGLIALAEDLMR